MKLTEICLVNTWSDRFSMEGKLSLLHVNDTNHVVEYKDNERSITLDVDLVELRSPDSTIRFTFPRGSNDKLVFKVQDDAEFSVLCQAKEDCQAICDLKLRLNSVLRDSYYAGIYSNLDPDAKINLSEEMDRLKKENPGVFFSALLNASERKPDMNGTVSKVHREASDENTIRLSEVICVFCDSSKAVVKDLDFVLHPNVSQNSAHRPVFMCNVCIENWKEFRENAEHEEQLVLPGEVNEEICAVCSDTPESLVLCGDCPRSFCKGCLAHLLTPAELLDLEGSDEDWICVCCVAGQSRHPPLARSAWKMVVMGLGRRGHSYGTLTPFTRKNHATVYSSQKMMVQATALPSAPILPVSSTLATSGRLVRTAAAAPKAEETPAEVKKSGRGARKASYDEEEVDPLASLHAANRNSDNNRGKRMEKRQRDLTGGVAANPEPDEKYYFGQYVGYYNLLCEDVAQRVTLPAKGKGKRKVSDDVPTDDVCFLCKDGGDLIECDWRCPTARNGERCLKVYHTYCLDYEVAEEEWTCPRHYCDMCGSKTLKYLCKYCPVSICANCPEKIVNKYGHARYCEVQDALSGAWRHTPTAPGVQSIVCHTCTEMLEVISSTAVESIKVSSNSSAGLQGSASVEVMLAELHVQKRFPGAYEGGSSGGGSVFRKDPSSSSDNASTSAPFVYAKGKALPPKSSKPKSSSSSGSSSKWSYRRWSDKETKVLRAAVRVHGDDAEAIKRDPKFSQALQFRHIEAIWNKVLREALIPSDEEGSGEEEEGESEDEEEDSVDEEHQLENKQEIVGGRNKRTGKIKVEATDVEEHGREVVEEMDVDVEHAVKEEESAAIEVPKGECVVAQGSDELSADISTRPVTPLTPVTPVLSDEVPGLLTTAVKEEDASRSCNGVSSHAKSTQLLDETTTQSNRCSSRLSTDASVSTLESKRSSSGGGRGRGRGGRGGRGSARRSPATVETSTDQKSRFESDRSSDEGEEEVPTMVATRGTRRQSDEKVLSTRSGKKLFLSGSDLLPSLH